MLRTNRTLQYAVWIGAGVFIIAVLLALKALGLGDGLTADVDGRAAMTDGRLTAFGWWSVLWRAALLGLGCGVLAGLTLALWGRRRREMRR